VKLALHLLDEFGDIVQGKPRFEITEIAGPYLKGLPLGSGPPAFQPAAQHLVDDIAERPAGELHASVLSLAATSSSRVNVVRMSYALIETS
jgi:hypothetical protein